MSEVLENVVELTVVSDNNQTYTKPLSSTSIESFLQCEAKFVRNYLLKYPKDTDSNILKFGRAIHDCLEKSEDYLKELNIDKVPNSVIDSFIESFREIAVEHKLNNATLVNEGEALLRQYFQDFDNSDKVIETEYFFNITTKYGVRIVGAIDKLVELDPETVVVVDYKTGNYSKTEEELYNDIQLSMYDLAVRYEFPQYKHVVLMLHYLKNKPVCTYRNDEDREHFEKFLVEVDKRIRALTPDAAKEMKNKFCPWCDFRETCKSYADTYNKVPDYPELAIGPNTTDDDVIKALELIDINEKILDERKRAFKFWVSQRQESTGVPVEANGKIANIRQSGRIQYDPSVVYNSIPLESFLSLVSIKKRELDNFLKDNPKFRTDVERTASFSYNDFFIKVSKK